MLEHDAVAVKMSMNIFYQFTRIFKCIVFSMVLKTICLRQYFLKIMQFFLKHMKNNKYLQKACTA